MRTAQQFKAALSLTPPGALGFGLIDATNSSLGLKQRALATGGAVLAVLPMLGVAGRAGAVAEAFAAEEVPQLGGAYRAVRTAATEAGIGGQVHHMPSFGALSAASSELSYGKAPAIWMQIGDHADTLSHGAQGIAGAQYRATQQALIESGQFLDALKMDVDAIRALWRAVRWSDTTDE